MIMVESPHGIVANVLGYSIVVCEFKLQLHDYVHFQTNNLGKCLVPLNPPSCGLNGTTTVLPQGWLGH